MTVIYIIAYTAVGGDEDCRDVNIAFYVAEIEHVFGNDKSEG